MDDKLTAKTAKFTSLENLYVYGRCDVFTHNQQYNMLGEQYIIVTY